MLVLSKLKFVTAKAEKHLALEGQFRQPPSIH